MKNCGGIISVKLRLCLGIFSFNKTTFIKEDIKYKIKTLIILFIKYELISYIRLK